MIAKDKRIIEKAKMLMDRNDPEQNEKIKQELESLYRKGSTHADEALIILSQYELRQRRTDPGKERLVRQLRSDGLALNGPDDGRLIAYLHRLSQQSTQVVKMLGQVQSRFREWFETEMARQDKRPANNSTHLNELASWLERLPGLGKTLGKTLGAYRLHRDTLVFEDVTQRISTALKTWDLPQAWHEFEKLESAPAPLRAKVRAIRDEILAIGSLNDKAQILAGRNLIHSLDWDNASLGLVHYQEIGQFLSHQQLPASKRDSLLDVYQKLQEALLTYLKNQAKMALDFESLAHFQEKYQVLFGSNPEVVLAQKSIWFEKGRNRLLTNLTAKVVAAVNPAALQDALRNVAMACRRLPPCLASELEERLIELQTLQEAWAKLLRGEEILAAELAPIGKASVRPKCLESDITRYTTWMDAIQNGRQALNLDGKNPEVLETAFRLSGEILDHRDSHVAALELRRFASQISSSNAMDMALRRLEVARFLTLVNAESSDHPYRSMIEKAEVLRQLAKAAEIPVDFADLPQVQAWTELWHKATKALPEDIPEALAMKLTAIRIDRKIEWHRALESINQTAGSFPFWHEWLNVLDRFEREFGLFDFVLRFGHWERIATIRHLIEEEKWQDAAGALANLAHDNPEYGRLRGILKLARARAEGLNSLSKELLDSWSTLTKAHSPDEMVDLLEDTLAQAWENREVVVLENLKATLDRVIQEGIVPSGRMKRLEFWRECLRLEPILLSKKVHQVDLLAFFALYKSAKKHGFFQHWMRNIIETWKKDDAAIILYAWSKKAFPRANNLENLWCGLEYPEKVLHEQTLLHAAHAIDLLKSDSLPPQEALIEVERQLDLESQRWEELRNLLVALPKKVAFYHPPDALQQALDRVRVFKEATSKLETLEREDLRDRDANFKLSMMYSQLGSLVNDGFQIAGSLRDRVTNLKNIAEAKFSHSQLMKLAIRAGDMEHIEEPGLFFEIAHRLEKLHEHFRRLNGTHLAFWEILSGECLKEIPAKVGMLVELPSGEDYQGLITAVKKLEDNEVLFKNTVKELLRKEPTGSDIDPERRGDYLELFPKEAPASKRAFYLFHRYAQRKDASNKMHQARAYLPDWIHPYLDRGLPWS